MLIFVSKIQSFIIGSLGFYLTGGILFNYFSGLLFNYIIQYFEAKDAKLQLFKDRENPDKLKLSINGKNIFDWFRQKYREFKEAIGMNPKHNMNKGIRR